MTCHFVAIWCPILLYRVTQKNKTLEMMICNWFRPFLVFRVPCIDQNCLISVLNHFFIHQNTQLNAETKYQASNRHIFRVWGRPYSLILLWVNL